MAMRAGGGAVARLEAWIGVGRRKQFLKPTGRPVNPVGMVSTAQQLHDLVAKVATLPVQRQLEVIAVLRHIVAEPYELSASELTVL
jgi:hypothetical protein